MKKYIYQKFLLQCEYEGISLEPLYDTGIDVLKVQYINQEYNILDTGGLYMRKVQVSDLDRMVDGEYEWQQFTEKVQGLDALILVIAPSKYPNPIVGRYREATIKAYVYRLLQSGVRCILYKEKKLDS